MCRLALAFRRRLRRRRRWLPLLAAPVGALVFIQLFGQLPVEIAGSLLEVGVRLDWAPQTRILIPPVGEIRANTHTGLLSFDVTLWNIDLESARRAFLGENGQVTVAPADFETFVVDQWRRTARSLALFVAGLGTLGAAAAAFVAGPWRCARKWLTATSIGLLLSVGLILPPYLTYDVKAFRAAEYQGIVEAAPWMLTAVRDSLGRFEALGDQLRTLAGNLYTLFERIEDLAELGIPPADLVVLHISDLHNNAPALEFVEAIAHRFSVDFIIDTGDITDWGTPLEAELVDRIGRLGLPYFVTPGNHESPLVLEKLRSLPNVTVLENRLQTVMGLRIYGFADPGAYRDSPYHLAPQAVEQQRAMIEEAIRNLSGPVDLIAVHNHRTAAGLPDGLAQAILCGHNHVLSVDTSRPTVRINAGTTGAAGIRGLQATESVPYSLAILYFRRSSGGLPGQDGSLRLAVVDTVRVTTLPARSLTLERIILSDDDGTRDPGEAAAVPSLASPPAKWYSEGDLRQLHNLARPSGQGEPASPAIPDRW